MTTLKRPPAAHHKPSQYTLKTVQRELAQLAPHEFELQLSFPAPELMQNRREGRHWSYAHEAKVAHRQEAYLLARQSITQSGFEARPDARHRVEMVFCPPDNRRRDVSNLHAAMKAALDGIAEAMEIDDSAFTEHEQRMSAVHARGCVRVRVLALR